MSIESEPLITLAEAAEVVNERLPASKKITATNIRRWATHGVHRHRLDTQQVGLEYFTSAEALTRFFNRHARVH